MKQYYTTRLHDSEEQARSLRLRVSRQQHELEERAIVIEQFLADGDQPKTLISANLAILTHQYQKLEEISEVRFKLFFVMTCIVHKKKYIYAKEMFFT
jgi:hypothetical protein